MIGKLIAVGHFLILSLLVTESVGASQEDKQKSIHAAIALQECRVIENDSERLKCFDGAAIRFAPPTYKGKLGKVTEPFELKSPHRLRYRSSGVIFVLYVRDKQGNVLQNLHIGGRGEDEYIIEQPGWYSLKMDGSAGWEIWLEPLDNDETLMSTNK